MARSISAVVGLLLLCFQYHLYAQSSHWQAFPIKPGNDEVRALYCAPDDSILYITGSFDFVNSGDSCNVMKWDGTAATQLPKSPLWFGYRVIKYQGKLIITGNPGIAIYDGIRWTRLDSLSSITVDCLEYFGDRLLFAGAFKKIAGNQIANGALWDGARGWSDFFRVDTVLQDPTWGIESTVQYKNKLYVGGNINPTSKPLITEIACFDGNTWGDVGGGIHGNGLSAVSKMLIWKDDLYVCGEFFERDGAPGNCIARWDGNKWHKLGSGITQFGGTEAAIYDMDTLNGNLYVVGVFTLAGGIQADGFAKWDGEKWCSLGSSFQNVASCVKSYRNEIWIGGAFKNIDGDTSLCRIARWTGGAYVKERSNAYLQVKPEISSRVTIVPNPGAGGRFTIRVNTPQRIREVSFSAFAATGKRVWSDIFSLVDAGFERELDLSGFPPKRLLLL